MLMYATVMSIVSRIAGSSRKSTSRLMTSVMKSRTGQTDVMAGRLRNRPNGGPMVNWMIVSTITIRNITQARTRHNPC